MIYIFATRLKSEARNRIRKIIGIKLKNHPRTVLYAGMPILAQKHVLFLLTMNAGNPRSTRKVLEGTMLSTSTRVVSGYSSYRIFKTVAYNQAGAATSGQLEN